MFENIFKTFLRAIVLFVLLWIAFSIAFYMAFYDPEQLFAPLSTPGLSILSVLAYITGSADFYGVFSLSEELNSETSVHIPFIPISIILWITFVIVMVVLLINMLVSRHNQYVHTYNIERQGLINSKEKRACNSNTTLYN